MLTIKCSKCGKKLIKYHKIGKGKVLKCIKTRITKVYHGQLNGQFKCPCGNVLGEEDGSSYKMDQTAFTYSGTYTNK